MFEGAVRTRELETELPRALDYLIQTSGEAVGVSASGALLKKF